MTSAGTVLRITLGMAGMFVSFTGAAQISDSQSRLVEANTRFSFKLFHQLVNETPDKNLLLTPTGLSLTFALFDNGADPGTREEIESAFEFKGLSLVEINEGAKALRAALQLSSPISKNAKKPDGVAPQQWKAIQATPPNGTSIADSLWLNSMNFPETFLKVNRDYYGADAKRFMPTPSPSIQISRWATERTGKSITVTPGRMLKNAFLLVDVTFFRGFWKHDFPESATKPGTFTLVGGKTKQVPFMYEMDHFNYFEGEQFQAVELKYSNQASMFIFLPSEASSLKEFESVLNAENRKTWQSKFDSRMGTVGLPRFQMETGFDVRAALEDLA